VKIVYILTEAITYCAKFYGIRQDGLTVISFCRIWHKVVKNPITDGLFHTRVFAFALQRPLGPTTRGGLLLTEHIYRGACQSTCLRKWQTYNLKASLEVCQRSTYLLNDKVSIKLTKVLVKRNSVTVYV